MEKATVCRWSNWYCVCLLTVDMLKIFLLCSTDLAVRNNTGWCSIMTKSDIDIINYEGDLWVNIPFAHSIQIKWYPSSKKIQHRKLQRWATLITKTIILWDMLSFQTDLYPYCKLINCIHVSVKFVLFNYNVCMIYAAFLLLFSFLYIILKRHFISGVARK